MTNPEAPDPADALARRPELAAQAARLGVFLEEARARGEMVPQEADDLFQTLNALVSALDTLAGSLAQAPAPRDGAGEDALETGRHDGA